MIDAHDSTQSGGASGTDGLTAADTRTALEGNPSLMTELGLAWVQRHPPSHKLTTA